MLQWGHDAMADRRPAAALARVARGQHAAAWLPLNRDLQEQHGLTRDGLPDPRRALRGPERRMRMSTLADHTQLSRSRLSHQIDRIIKAGLVARKLCEADACATADRPGWDTIVAAAPTTSRACAGTLSTGHTGAVRGSRRGLHHHRRRAARRGLSTLSPRDPVPPPRPSAPDHQGDRSGAVGRPVQAHGGQDAAADHHEQAKTTPAAATRIVSTTGDSFAPQLSPS